MSGELNNALNWSLAYQEYKEAVQVTPQGGYTPLPAFEVPITFTTKILIAKTVSNIPTGKRWKWAGNLRAFQMFPNAGINSQKSEIANFSLNLNRSKLLVLPDLASGYELVLSDAFWLRDLQLTIYEFTGILSDSLYAMVGDIKTSVEAIEEVLGD